MQFKPVKNVNRPGRPPSMSKWAKDNEGNFIRNDAGEFGYETLTEADIAAKKPRAPKKVRVKKEGAPRAAKKAVVVDDSLKAILLNKKTYKQLAATDLEKIVSIINGLMASAKASERQEIEAALAKLQAKLQKLG